MSPSLAEQGEELCLPDLQGSPVQGGDLAELLVTVLMLITGVCRQSAYPASGITAFNGSRCGSASPNALNLTRADDHNPCPGQK